MTATSLTGLRAGLYRRRRFGGHSGRRARQFDRETAAAPESGTQFDARPEQRGDACADRQAQAEPPFLARFAAAELEELLEDLRLVDAGDTDAVVAHLQPHAPVAAAARRHQHAAAGGMRSEEHTSELQSLM